MMLLFFFLSVLVISNNLLDQLETNEEMDANRRFGIGLIFFIYFLFIGFSLYFSNLENIRNQKPFDWIPLKNFIDWENKINNPIALIIALTSLILNIQICLTIILLSTLIINYKQALLAGKEIGRSIQVLIALILVLGGLFLMMLNQVIMGGVLIVIFLIVYLIPPKERPESDNS